MNCNVVAAVHNLDIVGSTAHHTGNYTVLFPVCESSLFGTGNTGTRGMYWIRAWEPVSLALLVVLLLVVLWQLSQDQ